MTKIRNGTPAGLLGAARWGKSSYSGAVGNCVELAWLAGGHVAVRNSRDPNGPALIHAHTGIEALVAAVKNW
ncbi:MAG TPA: DUF397 domain-containing protein [Actinophytocola sp.]|nr:DUF397 domain-containing protein [Actinophytocola sp.]HEV2783281.1 DUF397 domain-containing protein [Actinophytocola sp.]